MTPSAPLSTGTASRDTERLVKVLAHHAVTQLIDVGANEGQFGQRLRLGGYGGSILSVEPVPAVRDALARRVEDDAAWMVAAPIALGATAGTGDLLISGASDLTSLAPMTRAAQSMLDDSRTEQSIEVEIGTLDAFVPSWLSEEGRAALKIDTQGTELDVLRGGRGVMDRFVVLILELSLVPLYEGEADWRTVLDSVAALGFDPVLFLPGYFNKATARQVGMDGVFVRRDCLDRRLG